MNKHPYVAIYEHSPAGTKMSWCFSEDTLTYHLALHYGVDSVELGPKNADLMILHIEHDTHTIKVKDENDESDLLVQAKSKLKAELECWVRVKQAVLRAVGNELPVYYTMDMVRGK